MGAETPGRSPEAGGTTPPAVAPSGFYYLLDLEVPRLMLRTPRASVCLEFKTILNVLIACWSSTSDQAESASFASSIEHVHNFTVILPHRMQGMIRSPYSLNTTRASSLSRRSWVARFGRCLREAT